MTGQTYLNPLLKISIHDYPLVMPVCQSNKGYETNHSTYRPMIICNGNQGNYSDRRVYEIIIVNEIHYETGAITFSISSFHCFVKLSYAEDILAYLINLEMYIRVNVVSYCIEKET
jgi:hypothetical protein